MKAIKPSEYYIRISPLEKLMDCVNCAIHDRRFHWKSDYWGGEEERCWFIIDIGKVKCNGKDIDKAIKLLVESGYESFYANVYAADGDCRSICIRTNRFCPNKTKWAEG